MVTFPQNSYVYGLASALLHDCRTMAPERVQDLLLPSTFYLQNEISWEWAMLGSNQRPLPCEGRSITSWLFASVQKYLQNRTFAAGCFCSCSWLFVWVGVLIGVVRGVPHTRPSPLPLGLRQLFHDRALPTCSFVTP